MLGSRMNRENLNKIVEAIKSEKKRHKAKKKENNENPD